MKRIKKLWRDAPKTLLSSIEEFVDDIWGMLRGVTLTALMILVYVPVAIPVSIVVIIYRKIRGTTEKEEE